MEVKPRDYASFAHDVTIVCRLGSNLLLSSLTLVGVVLTAMLLITNVWAAGSDRQVALTALVNVENFGDRPMPSYFFRLTVPATDHPQQRLLAVNIVPEDVPDRKRHKNGSDEYLEFKWAVPAHSSVRREVTFILDLTPYEADAITPGGLERESLTRFLNATSLVESDAPEVRAIADQLMEKYTSPQDRARAAFDYARTMLKVRKESKNRGALYALRTGGGDCTEYAAVFAALSRAMGIPARLTAEFLFGRDESQFSQPNHHSAEVFLDGRWLPVDANLAVDPSFGYGYGFGGTRKVILRREGAWVWSSWSQDRDPNVKVEVSWSVRNLTTESR
jgi:transglutaminase-like putative cysteine protease